MPVTVDGLELANFTVPDKPLAPPKTIFHGGPWRERQRIKRKQKQFQANGANGSTSSRIRTGAETVTQEEIDISEEIGARDGSRPSKRPRTDPSTGIELRFRGGQVISTLFKSNPTPKTIFETPDTIEDQAVEPSNAPLTREQLNFTELGLGSRVATHLTEKLSINAPTAIQKAAIPILLKSESDAFIQAETGSGKTYAYILPILQQLISLSTKQQIHRNSGLFAIILVPTRELTKQILAVLEPLLRCAKWIVCGTVSGGESKKSEKAIIRKGVNILIATPGRLADHLVNTKSLDPSSVRWLVLDEGDRLMELGFEEDIRKILKFLNWRLNQPKENILEGLPEKRVNILCSATMKGNVQELGEMSLKNAEHITTTATHSDEMIIKSDKFTVPAQLKQSFLVVPAKLRLVTLIGLLKNTFARCQPTAKVIVFFSCADSVDFHFKVFTRESKKGNLEEAQNLKPVQPKTTSKQSHQPVREDQSVTWESSAAISSESRQVTVYRLHGSLAQAVRSNTLKEFSSLKGTAVLFCTDIAARGLDLPHVDRVVEFDPAFSREEHLHRVGRTARAGNSGNATIFLMPGSEEGYTNILKEEREIPGSVSGQAAEHVLKVAFQQWENTATELQLDIERWVLAHPVILESARKAFKSHIRAYATHVKDERDYFDIKEMHLGHLAKAFGLRDRPGSVNVPGMRASGGKVRRAVVAPQRKIQNLDVNIDDVDVSSSKRMMEAKAKMMNMSIDEFNLA